MEESTRSLLRTIAEACRTVGSANDCDDRGGAEEAARMREEARRSVADALAAASEDDRDRISCLFGPDTASRFDRLSWTTAEDHIASLLARDPELPAAWLRRRLPELERRIEELRSAGGLPEERLVVRYTRDTSPSMLTALRGLVGRNGDPPGWFWVRRVSYHLNLAGEGLREELRDEPPEPSDLLVDGVWIHIDMDLDAGREGIPVLLRSRDGAALARVRDLLLARLAADGWEVRPATT